MKNKNSQIEAEVLQHSYFYGNFPAMIRKCMQCSNCTIDDLVELTGIARRTLERMVSSKYYEKGYKSSKDNVIAVAVALKLPFIYSFQLIHKAGYSLTETERDRFLIYLLTYKYDQGVSYCNEELKKYGFAALTNGEIIK